MFFHSVCPHHLLPYHGFAQVAYVPGDRIIGFSNITRLVDCFAHRLVLQEEIGKELRKTEDAREAQQAFVEKRKPVWRGR